MNNEEARGHSVAGFFMSLSCSFGNGCANLPLAGDVMPTSMRSSS
jgi:hypothetical protein